MTPLKGFRAHMYCDFTEVLFQRDFTILIPLLHGPLAFVYIINTYSIVKLAN